MSRPKANESNVACVEDVKNSTGQEMRDAMKIAFASALLAIMSVGMAVLAFHVGAGN